jgi:hypothetical protein
VTTAAVATVVAVLATGAGPITAARRMRRRASGMSFLLFVWLVVGLDRGEHRLDGYPSAGHELAP